MPEPAAGALARLTVSLPNLKEMLGGQKASGGTFPIPRFLLLGTIVKFFVSTKFY